MTSSANTNALIAMIMRPTFPASGSRRSPVDHNQASAKTGRGGRNIKKIWRSGQSLSRSTSPVPRGGRRKNAAEVVDDRPGRG